MEETKAFMENFSACVFVKNAIDVAISQALGSSNIVVSLDPMSGAPTNYNPSPILHGTSAIYRFFPQSQQLYLVKYNKILSPKINLIFMFRHM